MKQSFKWGIRGGANLTTFCCVLRVTWCHRVCFSCYFCQNGAAINVSKFDVSTSHPHVHIRRCSIEPAANSPKFTQNSHQIQACEFCTNVVRIWTSLHCFPLVLSSHRHLFFTLIMSQTLSQLASLQSRPDPSADTLVAYQVLPVAQHGMEEATYNSEALAVEEIVDWAASLFPAPHVIHIDLRTPTCNSYFGGKAWATELWREPRRRVPSLHFCTFFPPPPPWTSC